MLKESESRVISIFLIKKIYGNRTHCANCRKIVTSSLRVGNRINWLFKWNTIRNRDEKRVNCLFKLLAIINNSYFKFLY